MTHSTPGALASEITAALGSNPASDYTKLKIYVGNASLAGGDWGALRGAALPAKLPNVTSLELVYTSGSHVIPDSALSSGYNAGSAWLKELTLTNSGGSLISIGSYAFGYCSELTGTLEIPASVTSIGAQAFYNCTKLTGLSLPAAGSLTTIGNLAFCDCSGLTATLTIPASVTTIDYYAFRGGGLTGLSLPATGSLTTIDSSAFSGCEGLTGTLTIPASVTTIGMGAFNYCSGLTSLSLPASGSLTTIGIYAFYVCPELIGTVEIPASVTSIGAWAFGGCTNLDALVFRNETAAPTMFSSITDQSQITAYYPSIAEPFYFSQPGFPSNREPYDDSTARIISFWMGGVRGSIHENKKIITINLPGSTDLTALTPIIGYIGASIFPSGTRDFTTRSQAYTVTPIAGSATQYMANLYSYPSVSGSNNLSGGIGNVGTQTVTASIFGGSHEQITLTAAVGGKTATASRTGDGTASFAFAASDLNTLAPGSYDITVSAKATAHNEVIAATKVGTLTVLSSLPASYTMFAGGRVTWDPKPDGGTWEWDEEYFSATFNSPATFTALKPGTSTISYTVNGIVQSVPVTIEGADLPKTGQNDTWIWVLVSLAVICGAGAVLIGKKERARTPR